MLDAPIPALGAAVARAPRSRAPPAEALRKSARAKGATEGPVLERAMRATAEKNSMAKVSIEPSASPADNEVAATPSSVTPAPAVEPKMQAKRKGGLKLDSTRAKGAVRGAQANAVVKE
ncbi:uncharacterized protein [Lolium perenne]|uniref:uncharacterized protein n=1 Tax=Lolium perenne TaxID=4522 RepID=UPI0021F644A2|nr:uncharacterized protein LOC127335242 [Lolium perenne]